MIARVRHLLLIAVLLLCGQTAYGQSGISKPLSTTTCPGDGCVILGVQGQGGVSVQVTGSFSGTLTFEVSLDGVTYVAAAVTPAGSSTQVTTTTSTGIWGAPVGGVGQFRVRFSSYSSGTATVRIGSSLASALGNDNGGGGGGGGAPTDATYVLNTAAVDLPNAQDLSALTTGLAVVTNGTGLVSTVGDPLSVAHGGTGLASGTSGGILGFTGATTLASSVALTNHAIVLGAGAAATPTPLGSLGTATTLLHGNATGAPSFAAVSLTADVSGTLPVANGGTGLTSGTDGGILGFTASGTIASSGALTLNRLMLGGGAGATPTVLGSLGTTTTLLHGNAAGAPTFGAVSLTADITGTLAFGNGGTGVASAADDTTLISSGSAWVATTINDCTGAGKAITYVQATNSFGCNTISGGGTPGGSNTQVQFNDGGSTFGGDAGFTYNKTTDYINIVGGITVGSAVPSSAFITFFDSSSGGTTPGSNGLAVGVNGTTAFFYNRENGPVAFGTNNNQVGTISTSGLAAFSGSLRTGGDSGGAASNTTITNATDTTLTNAYTVKGGQIATTANTGWIKIYIGTAVAWVPYWANATP